MKGHLQRTYYAYYDPALQSAHLFDSNAQQFHVYLVTITRTDIRFSGKLSDKKFQVESDVPETAVPSTIDWSHWECETPNPLLPDTIPEEVVCESFAEYIAALPDVEKDILDKNLQQFQSESLLNILWTKVLRRFFPFVMAAWSATVAHSAG